MNLGVHFDVAVEGFRRIGGGVSTRQSRLMILVSLLFPHFSIHFWTIMLTRVTSWNVQRQSCRIRLRHSSSSQMMTASTAFRMRHVVGRRYLAVTTIETIRGRRCGVKRCYVLGGGCRGHLLVPCDKQNTFASRRIRGRVSVVATFIQTRRRGFADGSRRYRGMLAKFPSVPLLLLQRTLQVLVEAENHCALLIN